jgi:pilus assembly protein TadC
MLMRRFLLPTLLFALLMPALVYWRAYPWQLALLSSLAISALLYSAGRMVENMRILLREMQAARRGRR